MSTETGSTSDNKKKPEYPESTIESANRRNFIKKAAIATAAVGVASVSLKGSLLPISSAASCHPMTLAKQPVTTDTACKNRSGGLAVFDASTDITGVWKKGAHLKGGSRSALLCVTNDYRCFCCCCMPYPQGISGRGASVGVSGISCLGAGVSGRSQGESQPGVSGVSCFGPGVCGTSLSDNPGVSGISLNGPALSALSYENVAICAQTAIPTIARFSNDGQLFKDNSAEIQFQNGCYTPVSWYEGVGGAGNPCGLSEGQFYIQNCRPRLVLNTCGKIGIGTATPNVTLQVNGGLSVGTRTVNSAYSMLDSDFVVLVNATMKPVQITLPTASNIGQVVFIKKIDQSKNSVVVQAKGSDEIEGASSRTLASTYSSMSLVAGGNRSWYILSVAT